MDALIFGFGAFVTLIVGVGLTLAIVSNNRDGLAPQRGEERPPAS